MSGTWFQTYHSGIFDFAAPSAEHLSLEVIAHALSMQCRYNGHCERFYSVAEHSVHVMARVAELRPLDWTARRVALLHDASEAVLGDIPSPLKRTGTFDEYRRLEREVQGMILDKFLGFVTPADEIRAAVKLADMELLATEKAQIMAAEPRDWGLLPDPLDVTIFGWAPPTAEAEFLAAAENMGLRR